MPDSIFLEVTESKDAAGKNRPEFCLGKLPLLDIALIDLIIECSLGIFKQCINFIEGGTVLILGVHQVVLKRYNMFIAGKFVFEFCKFLHRLITLFFVVEIELAEQELLVRLFVLEEGDIIGNVTLNHLIILHEVIGAFL